MNLRLGISGAPTQVQGVVQVTKGAGEILANARSGPRDRARKKIQANIRN